MMDCSVFGAMGVPGQGEAGGGGGAAGEAAEGGAGATPENAGAGVDAGGGAGAWAAVALLAAGLAAWLWILRAVIRGGRGVLGSVRWGAVDSVPGAGGGLIGGAAMGGRISAPGMVLVLCGLAAWLSQTLGAALALGASGIGFAETTLRSGVVGQAGAYGAAGLVIAGVLAVLPGAARVIGAGGFGAGGVGLEVWGTVRRAVVWMLVAGPAVYVVGAGSLWVARVAARLTGSAEPGQVAHQTLKKLTEPGASESVWWWLTVVSVVVGAPLIEEFIYRGFIQTGALKITRSVPLAVGATSAVFAVAHVGAVPWHAVVTLFFLSVSFGLALERTGRLWVCVLMHAGFNAANVVLSMV